MSTSIYMGVRNWVADPRLPAGGCTEGIVVVRDGQPLAMKARPNRSQADQDAGPEWGYGGHGPGVLAFTLLHDAMGPVVAGSLWDLYRNEVVAKWPHHQGGVEWSTTSDQIRAWVAHKRQQLQLPPLDHQDRAN
jgi:hypothetical protein